VDTVVQAIMFLASIAGGLVILYTAARLVSMAWHNTKAEYEILLKRKGEDYGSEEE